MVFPCHVLRVHQPASRMGMWFAGTAVAFLLRFSVAAAQEHPDPERSPPSERSRRAVSVPHEEAPTARAVHIAETISVDGRLDEPVWMTAPAVAEFWQMSPDEGAPATRPTEVRLLYDDEALYIGAWLWDDRGRDVPTRLYRRDVPFMESDVLSVHFDTYHDHRTSYRVVMNPSGAKRDVILIAGQGGGLAGLAGGDVSWNPVWEGKTTVSNEGWFAEIRIPFSQLRFGRAEEQVWGLQIERKDRAGQSDAQWVYTPSTEVGSVPRFGHLVGIRGVRSGHRLELLPYLGGRAEYVAAPQSDEVSFANPFPSDADYFGYGGIDLKYLVTQNLVVDATVNPDFGQVEVDPAVINLTAYETRLSERRPFFVEGADNFRFGEEESTQILYTRRIGRSPQGSLPRDAIYHSSPPATTIIGAAKLTGKTAKGWSLGVLNAVTAGEGASWVGADQTVHRQDVEPLTNYFAGRARRELRGGETMYGALFTAVHRDDVVPLDQTLHSAAYSGGVDFRHEWSGRRWLLAGYFSSSLVSGTSAALIGTQRRSSRYFQRPDADYLEVDSAATSLFGYSTRLAFEKQTGQVRFDAVASAVSPGYEVNDIGFQTIADRIGAAFTLEYVEFQRGRHFQNWSVRTSQDWAWNYGGDLVGAEIGLVGEAQLLDFSRLQASFSYLPPMINTALTRGGPGTQDPAGYSGLMSYRTDRRKKLFGNVALRLTGDRSGAWEREIEAGVGLGVSETLDVSVGPTFTNSRVTAQYVTSIAAPLEQETFGRRFVFADLRQRTLAFDVRVNVVLSPEVSFELFAQPLISTGDYEGLKELATPRSFRFSRYGTDVGTLTRTDDQKGYRIDPDGTGPALPFTIDDRDFSHRSFRANAVFRWEWRPGSTLFLVWQQRRLNELEAFRVERGTDAGQFRFGRDARDIFRQRPDNVFLIKASFWMSP